MLSHPYSCLLRQNMLRTFTNSSRPMRPLCPGINDARWIFKEPYRSHRNTKSPLNVIKRTSNLGFYVIYALLMPFFMVKLPFWKQNSNYPDELLLLEMGGMSWYQYFRWSLIKSAKLTRTLSAFLVPSALLEANGEHCSYWLRCALGPLLQTHSSKMSFRLESECKCLGSVLSRSPSSHLLLSQTGASP